MRMITPTLIVRNLVIISCLPLQGSITQITTPFYSRQKTQENQFFSEGTMMSLLPDILPATQHEVLTPSENTRCLPVPSTVGR